MLILLTLPLILDARAVIESVNGAINTSMSLKILDDPLTHLRSPRLLEKFYKIITCKVHKDMLKNLIGGLTIFVPTNDAITQAHEYLSSLSPEGKLQVTLLHFVHKYYKDEISLSNADHPLRTLYSSFTLDIIVEQNRVYVEDGSGAKAEVQPSFHGHPIAIFTVDRVLRPL